MESFVAPKVAVCSTRNRLAKIMKSNNPSLRRRYRSTIVLATLWAGISVLAGPPGPTPQVPVGGGAPGPFPNTRVTGVNVVAKGSTTYNGNVEITGYEGNGPIPWTVTKYNRGDIAMRLAPGECCRCGREHTEQRLHRFHHPHGCVRGRGPVVASQSCFGRRHTDGPSEWAG